MKNVPKIAQGRVRQWVECNMCNTVAYYDYVPYSLSNPVKTAPCEHRFEDYKRISADEALIKL